MDEHSAYDQKEGSPILNYLEIEIIPFEGQETTPPLPQGGQPVTGKPPSPSKQSLAPKRKTTTQLSGTLDSASISIKSSLSAVQQQRAHDAKITAATQDATYTQEAFEQAWKAYATKVKSEKKESLYATLTHCKRSVNSEHLITLEIQNNLQKNALDESKASLLKFLSEQLNNAQIQLTYTIVEKKTFHAADRKSDFDRLAETYASLHKFRKLFNLDIEF